MTEIHYEVAILTPLTRADQHADQRIDAHALPNAAQSTDKFPTHFEPAHFQPFLPFPNTHSAYSAHDTPHSRRPSWSSDSWPEVGQPPLYSGNFPSVTSHGPGMTSLGPGMMTHGSGMTSHGSGFPDHGSSMMAHPNQFHSMFEAKLERLASDLCKMDSEPLNSDPFLCQGQTWDDDEGEGLEEAVSFCSGENGVIQGMGDVADNWLRTRSGSQSDLSEMSSECGSEHNFADVESSDQSVQSAQQRPSSKHLQKVSTLRKYKTSLETIFSPSFGRVESRLKVVDGEWTDGTRTESDEGGLKTDVNEIETDESGVTGDGVEMKTDENGVKSGMKTDECDDQSGSNEESLAKMDLVSHEMLPESGFSSSDGEGGQRSSSDSHDDRSEVNVSSLNPNCQPFVPRAYRVLDDSGILNVTHPDQPASHSSESLTRSSDSQAYEWSDIPDMSCDLSPTPEMTFDSADQQELTLDFTAPVEMACDLTTPIDMTRDFAWNIQETASQYNQPAISSKPLQDTYDQPYVTPGFFNSPYSQPATGSGLLTAPYNQTAVKSGRLQTPYSQPAFTSELVQAPYVQPAIARQLPIAPYDCPVDHKEDFLPIYHFSPHHLPKGFQNDSVFHSIMDIAQRVVRLEVQTGQVQNKAGTYASGPSEHDEDMCERLGTGFVENINEKTVEVLTQTAVLDHAKVTKVKVTFSLCVPGVSDTLEMTCQGRRLLERNFHSLTCRFECDTPLGLLPFLREFKPVTSAPRTSLFNDSCYFSDLSPDTSLIQEKVEAKPPASLSQRFKPEPPAKSVSSYADVLKRSMPSATESCSNTSEGQTGALDCTKLENGHGCENEQSSCDDFHEDLNDDFELPLWATEDLPTSAEFDFTNYINFGLAICEEFGLTPCDDFDFEISDGFPTTHADFATTDSDLPTTNIPMVDDNFRSSKQQTNPFSYCSMPENIVRAAFFSVSDTLEEESNMEEPGRTSGGLPDWNPSPSLLGLVENRLEREQRDGCPYQRVSVASAGLYTPFSSFAGDLFTAWSPLIPKSCGVTESRCLDYAGLLYAQNNQREEYNRLYKSTTRWDLSSAQGDITDTSNSDDVTEHSSYHDVKNPIGSTDDVTKPNRSSDDVTRRLNDATKTGGDVTENADDVTDSENDDVFAPIYDDLVDYGASWDRDLLNLDSNLEPLPEYQALDHLVADVLDEGPAEGCVCSRLRAHCVVISFPHGGVKCVSIGQFSRHGHVGADLYDAPTCVGSCGAPVLALHPETGSVELMPLLHAGTTSVNGLMTGLATPTFSPALTL